MRLIELKRLGIPVLDNAYNSGLIFIKNEKVKYYKLIENIQN